MEMMHKLDMLQDLACVQINNDHVLYLIGLLAEHAEEEEMTKEFLVWLRKTMG